MRSRRETGLPRTRVEGCSVKRITISGLQKRDLSFTFSLKELAFKRYQ